MWRCNVNGAAKSAFNRDGTSCNAWLSFLFLQGLWQIPVLADTTNLSPVTNTGLKDIHFKSVQCSEDGVWKLDIVNNSFAPSYVEYFFWLEDEQGDAVESHSGQLMLDAKSREAVQLTFGCEVPFTELKPHFRWAPVGFKRP